MQDRPTIDELLAAVEYFLDTEIVPNVPGARGFHGRVAANAIRIVRRELEREDEALAAEWAGLDSLLGPATPPIGRAQLRATLRERNEELCAQIETARRRRDVRRKRTRTYGRRTGKAGRNRS